MAGRIASVRARWKRGIGLALLLAAVATGNSAAVSATSSATGGSATGGSATDGSAIYRVPILMFHRIARPAEAADSKADLVVTPERFAAQLQALRDAGWRTITARDLARAMKSGAALPAKTFVITIDDGWSDGFTNAAPILARYGFVATYFVVAGRIGRGHALSAEQLGGLAAAGHEIGNHTFDHVALAGRPAATVEREVNDASDAIERWVGRMPTTLAYPNGSFDARVIAAVGHCRGIDLAVSVQAGVGQSWANRFRAPRIAVHEWTAPVELVRDLETWTSG